MLQHLPDIDQPSPSTLRRDHVPQHGHLLDPAHVLYLSVMVLLVSMFVVVLLFVLGLHAVFTRDRADSSLSFTGLNAFECFFVNLFMSLAVAESVMHVIRAVLLHYTIVIADCPRLCNKLLPCKVFLVVHNLIPGYATTWSSTLSLLFKQFENET
ncbi:hypothetical protein PF005_g14924 [Phytophthora fragariae]|uniref:Uncharacterized protein n=2 Tax=Phytophthora fragariae TaxID=53985 RepID=A0A6A3TYJ7_9STRA|nr:hypothetical protein PF003_g23247 [Phytophthora fragariae]KAE9109062.1 hypothetical protein PF007_g12397 [Phytophthora fragariae]KAE9144233.1 hypothetical protein PF006_g10811 [Phytophthora fragariae]KAE9201521.1 hypothetical protein PF005_g14924 [Phytophthora fragariae]KAE9228213.1 hypothetical protein PF002_g13608 [Phytophthora fragariae]